MKFFVGILLTMLLGYVAFLFNDSLPWWSVAVAAFIAGAAVPAKPWQNWLAGFLGMALLWAALAWWIDKANGGIMAGRMADVLPMKGSKGLLIVATSLVGGLVAAFASLTGSFLRKKAS
jgi:hypothetical protein